jgi:hypothetical protein
LGWPPTSPSLADNKVSAHHKEHPGGGGVGGGGGGVVVDDVFKIAVTRETWPRRT